MTTVLIADHHVLFRQGLAALLREQQDWQIVGEAGRDDEAVRLTGALAPSMVVLDIELPAIGGVATARAMRRVSPATRIVALSNYAHLQCPERMLEAGASAYVLKGGPFDALVIAMHVVLQGGTLVSRAAIGREARRAPRRSPQPSDGNGGREQDVSRLIDDWRPPLSS